MHKMKDSGVEWIGQIPEDWNVIPAGNLFDEQKIKNKDNEGGSPLSFRYGAIVDKNIVGAIDETVEETLSNYTVVWPNTIMINGLNLNYDFVTQRVARVPKQGIITSAYLAIMPNQKFINSWYAEY
jgi:type I restriction enzyme, S subunit